MNTLDDDIQKAKIAYENEKAERDTGNLNFVYNELLLAFAKNPDPSEPVKIYAGSLREVDSETMVSFFKLKSEKMKIKYESCMLTAIREPKVGSSKTKKSKTELGWLTQIQNLDSKTKDIFAMMIFGMLIFFILLIGCIARAGSCANQNIILQNALLQYNNNTKELIIVNPKIKNLVEHLLKLDSRDIIRTEIENQKSGKFVYEIVIRE